MARNLKVKILPNNDFIKVNELEPVSNPVFFMNNNIPTSDGLLSNEIFGITKDDRMNRFAYIELGDNFMHPLMYKILCKLDKNIKNVVHSVTTYSISSTGELKEDPNGKTGIKWLLDNIEKIKFKTTNSKERDLNIKFIKDNLKFLKMNKFIVLPPFYRDVNTNKQGYVGVGEINKLYSTLLVAVRALKESSEYGLTSNDSTKARIQELMLQIYNWFGGGTTIDGKPTSPMLPSKTGKLRMSGLRKTVDYSSRLVMSAPPLDVEKRSDMIVDLDHAAIPLSSVLVNLFPFVMFHIRRILDNEFGAGYNYIDKNGDTQRLDTSEYQLEYSDEYIQKQIDRYIRGYSNRLIPIKVPNKEGKNIRLRFKGRNVSEEDFISGNTTNTTAISDRDMTWCDIFFIAANRAAKDKTIVITRFPIDNIYNQIFAKINVSSTIKTVPMMVGDEFYKWYPDISQEDIGSNTSNMFIDTLRFNNAHVAAAGGDYDGDQGTVQALYSDEANAEVIKHLSAKSNYIYLNGINAKKPSNENIMALYSLTLVLPEDKNKLTLPVYS